MDARFRASLQAQRGKEVFFNFYSSIRRGGVPSEAGCGGNHRI